MDKTRRPEIHIEITYKSVMSSHTLPPRPPPTHWNVLFAPWQWKRSETKAKLCAVCFKSWTAGNALSYVTLTPHTRGPNSIYRLAHSTFAPDDDVRGAEIHLLAGRDGERVNYTSSSPVTSLHDPLRFTGTRTRTGVAPSRLHHNWGIIPLEEKTKTCISPAGIGICKIKRISFDNSQLRDLLVSISRLATPREAPGTHRKSGTSVLFDIDRLNRRLPSQVKCPVSKDAGWER